MHLIEEKRYQHSTVKSAEILIFDIYLLGCGWEQPQVGNSHKLGKARLPQGFGELVALQVTSNVPQFFLYLKKNTF